MTSSDWFPVQSLHVRKSYPHPDTNTKLTLILMFTLIPTLTLVTLLKHNSNCSSKTTKLACFRQTSPQNDLDGAILANALHHGLLLTISLRYALLSSRCLVFSAYLSGSLCGVTGIIYPVLTCRHYIIIIADVTYSH